MEKNYDLALMLCTEATTITALVDEIEYGENSTEEFLVALRQVSYRLRKEAERLANT